MVLHMLQAISHTDLVTIPSPEPCIWEALTLPHFTINCGVFVVPVKIMHVCNFLNHYYSLRLIKIYAICTT